MYWYVLVSVSKKPWPLYLEVVSLKNSHSGPLELSLWHGSRALRPRHLPQREGATLAMDCAGACAPTVAQRHWGPRWSSREGKGREIEKDNPKVESVWIIWRWTFDFREVPSHEHCLWKWCECCGDDFLCDILQQCRGCWHARICGAAPREAWFKLR